MTGLLQRDPARRLGANGGEEIKKHPFFAKYIDWGRLLAKRYTPPFKPAVVGFFSSPFLLRFPPLPSFPISLFASRSNLDEPC